MGKLHSGIDEALRSFIEAQHMFFVATAPLDASGHVNVSKGEESRQHRWPSGPSVDGKDPRMTQAASARVIIDDRT
jgi:hypothetical protein